MLGYNQILELLGQDLVSIDSCIAPLVQILNDYGIQTISSCCGHGRSRNIAVWLHPANIKLDSYKYTTKINTILFRIAKKIITKLAFQHQISIELIAPFNFCKKDYSNLVLDDIPKIRKKAEIYRNSAHRKYKNLSSKGQIEVKFDSDNNLCKLKIKKKEFFNKILTKLSSI